jgi:hypothetical protein
MSRHYNPHAPDPEPHPFRRSWQAAVGRIKLVAAWLLLPLTNALNWLFQLGSRPSAATILEIQNAQRSLPKAGDLQRELNAVQPRMADGDGIRHAFDRR